MFEISKYGLSEDEARRIVRGVAAGEYSLLLGAGFSVKAEARNGEFVGTADLISKIESAFDLTPEDPDSPRTLPVAYEDAQGKVSDEAIWKFFNRLFTGGMPGWRSVLSKLAWRRVWTLNIDDLPDSIFPLATPIHFKDDYRPTEADGRLQVVYLHGRATVRKPFVFSISEYRDQVQAPGPWQTIFFSNFNDQPFIVCGASLVGEMDLATALRTKNSSNNTRGLPSLAVIRGLSPAGAERIRTRLGLIPIITTGEEFFVALQEDVKNYLRENPALVVGVSDSNIANQFGRQFRAIGENSRLIKDPKHDFYGGDEPMLADVEMGLDAPLSFSKAAIDSVIAGISVAGKVPVVTLFGGPGSGKSTTMMRVLWELSTRHHAYLFRNEEAFSADVAVQCSENRVVVLGFDNAGDFGSEIREFVEKARKRGLKAAIVVTDRTSREKGMRVDFLNAGVARVDHSRLSATDALAVIDKRRSANRLGRFTGQKSADIRREFMTKHEADLMSALASMELGAEGFQRRIREIAQKIENAPELKRLLFVVALVHRWGYALPLHFAAAASGISSAAINRACSEDGALGDVVVVEPRGIRFRHRIVAERYFGGFTNPQERRSLSLRLAEAIAPVVNIRAIRARSYEFRLSRVLMDRRNVTEVVGSKKAALKWFEAMESGFSWNSRYWEQRALLEAENENFAPAYSFAKAAVSKERHPFPLTTLGAVCFMHCHYQLDKDIDIAWRLYCEGVEALDQAFALGMDRPETVFKPIATFLDNIMRLARYFRGDQTRRAKMATDFYRWMKKEEEVGFCGDDVEARREIQAFYLKMAVS